MYKKSGWDGMGWMDDTMVNSYGPPLYSMNRYQVNARKEKEKGRGKEKKG
jgi:hypothetical protein